MGYADEVADLTADLPALFDFESWTATPLVDPKHGAPTPDPERPEFEFFGRFDSWPKEVAPPYANSTRPETLVRHGTAKFILTAYGVADAVALTRGDRIERPATGDRFTVQFAQPDGFGNVALYLNRAK